MGKRNRNKASSGIVKIRFTAFTQSAATANLKTVALAVGTLGAGAGFNAAGTSFSNRLSSISGAFSMFRFTKLKVTLHPTTSAYAICYIPSGGGITAPATIQASMDQTYSVYMSANGTVPRVLNVPKAALRGEFPWYRCDATVDASEYIQGYFSMVTTGATDAVTLTFQGEIEYKGGSNSNVASPLNDEELERKIVSRYLQRREVTSSSLVKM